jgi:Lipocalin-like domain
MNRRSIFTLSIITVLGLAMVPGNTVAQQKSVKEQLVGTWTFVSATTKRPDGSLQWGSTPKGLAIFADNGRFSESIMR